MFNLATVLHHITCTIIQLDNCYFSLVCVIITFFAFELTIMMIGAYRCIRKKRKEEDIRLLFNWRDVN